MTQVSDRRLPADAVAKPHGGIADTVAPAPPATTCPLSVLIPTRNEAGNVDALIDRLSDALAGLPAEAIFVDDSDDTTPAVVEAAIRGRRARRPAARRVAAPARR